MVGSDVDATGTLGTARLARAVLPEPAGKLILLVALLALHAPTLRWLARVLTDTTFGLNAVLLLAAVALVVTRARRDLERPAEALRSLALSPPRAGWDAPAALLVASELAFLASARWLDIHIVGAVLLGLSLYAAAGLYLPAPTWRRGLPGLVLFLAVLPFGDTLQAYAGMPARTFTAHVVERVLSTAGVANVSAETVLVLESGLVYVDAPCSGLHSLRTGLVFFAGATWIERAALGAGWAARGLVFAALLVAANVVRVLVIVVVGPVAGLPRVAEIIHEPLGVLGFVAACAAAYAMLHFGRRAARATADAPAPRAPARADHGPVLVLGLAALTVVAALAHTPRPRRAVTAAPQLARLAAALPQGEAIPLTEAETGLFARVGQTTAIKHRFTWRGHPGSVLAVHSTSWRAHHAPEICLAGAGHEVDALQTWTVAPDHALRVAAVDRGARTALYWYQSRTRTTADLLTRVLSDLAGDEDEWVMVSILVEGAWPVGDARTLALYDSIRASVAAALTPRGPS